MADEEIEALRRIYTALQQHDVEEIRRSVAHDIEWTMPEALPWGGTHHGHDGLLSVAGIHEELVDGEWADPDEYFEAEGRYVVLGRTQGRVRASGAAFAVPFAHVWNMSHGLPTAFRAYLDTAPITAALDEPSDEGG